MAWHRRLSLRLRLLVALVALVCVGLVVADGVTYVSLRSFLLQRIDQQLIAAKWPVLRALANSSSVSPSFSVPPPSADTLLPPSTYGELLDRSGKVVAEVAFAYGGVASPPPSLPTQLVASAASAASGNAHSPLTSGQTFVTAGAASGSSIHYRVVASALHGAPYALVVAIPLTEMYQTLSRLLLIEALVTAAVLIGLGVLAWWIVRREMRPLEDMALTAGAIAAGDLTRRVEPAESRTEVGRLGLALNSMLAQIEQAFARRKASEDALRRFLAQASHELRTPLASIRGYAELFRRGAKDRPEDLELAMRRIEQEAARMGVLVEELLLLARLDEGRPMERLPVDLAQLARDAVADAAATEPERDIELDAPQPVVVSGDEARLRQLVTNLVMNALQHAGKRARVHVSARARASQAELEVRDDGVGMSEEVAAHVFEPFYRATPVDESRRAEQGGEGANRAEGVDRVEGANSAGLGLAIVAGIVEAHGGRIDLETAPHHGSRFTVRLPLAGEVAASQENQSVPVEPQPEA